MAINQNQVGPLVVQNGSTVNQRGGRTGETVVGDAHGHFQEAVLAGNVFIGANLLGTAVTTQAGLSATTPALTLYNPVGSGKNLVLWKVGIGVNAAPAAAVIFSVAYNLASAAAPTLTTLGTVTNAILGSTALPTGQCARVATLAAAPLHLITLGGCTGAAAISGAQFIYNLDGQIVVGPGVAISVQTSSAAAIVADMIWEEVLI